MKKLLSLLAAFSLVLTLAACKPEEKIVYVDVPGETVEVEKTPIEIPAEVTMANIDQFIERENVQLIDLRNYSDKMGSGYINGFETISFFEYLEKNAIIRNNGWTWQEDNIVDEAVLENFFDRDADAIFLMCASGTRAGFVKAALEQLGYSNVQNIGGINSYNGDNRVLGGLEENRLKFAANVYTMKHWTPKRDLVSPVYVMFEADTLKFSKYQIVYTSCTWRVPEENFKQVAYVELETDGTIKYISFDLDSQELYTPAVWGDSNPRVDGKNNITKDDYMTKFVNGWLVGKSPADIADINVMADATDFTDYDSFAGASVTLNNLLRAIQGLQEYHLNKN